MAPLASKTWPSPLPLMVPAQVGELPPVKSSTAPVATVNVPLELLPPPLNTNCPWSTSKAPPELLKMTDMTLAPDPPLFHTNPWLLKICPGPLQQPSANTTLSVVNSNFP